MVGTQRGQIPMMEMSECGFASLYKPNEQHGLERNIEVHESAHSIGREAIPDRVTEFD